MCHLWLERSSMSKPSPQLQLSRARPDVTRLGNVPVRNAKVRFEVAESPNSTCPVKAAIFISVNHSHLTGPWLLGGLWTRRSTHNNGLKTWVSSRLPSLLCHSTPWPSILAANTEKVRVPFPSITSSCFFFEYFLSRKRWSVYDRE